MPQLQVIEDPYAASNSEALNSAVSGFMPNIAAQAQAQELAARIKATNQQQLHLAQQMEQERQKFDWAKQDREYGLQDRKSQQSFEDAQGNYYRIATPAPVGLNGQPASPQDMERYYAEQNMRDQTARRMAHAGKDANDISQAFTGWETNFRSVHPSQQTSLPGMTPEIANNPVARKQYEENFGRNAAEQSVKGAAAASTANAQADETNIKLTNMRNAYQGLAGMEEVGPWAGGAIGRTWDKYGFGNSEAATQRDLFQAASKDLETELAKIKLGGQGPITDAERAMLSQMLPRLDDNDPRVGLKVIGDMMSVIDRIKQRNAANNANPSYGGQPQQGGLQPGKTVIDNHVYLGGNPADPQSWRAL